jgi:hypothetical protein
VLHLNFNRRSDGLEIDENKVIREIAFEEKTFVVTKTPNGLI